MRIPPPFKNERAASGDEAIALPEQYGPESRLSVGAQSILPMTNLRLARPEVLIDVDDLDLSYIRVEGDEIRIGALSERTDLLMAES